MAARCCCRFPSSSPLLLSNLLSRSQNPVSPLNFPIRNPNPNPNFSKINPNFPRLFSLASSSAIASPLASKESKPSLGHITRTDFPYSNQVGHGTKVIYLDNATASQLPHVVLNAMDLYYKSFNSNVHRGFNNLSAEAIDLYELARAKVAAFINAMSSKEIVFTKNATDAINLVAYSWGLSNLKSGDEVLLTIAEHHSAIVPWQLIAKQTGATLKYVGLTEEVPDIEQLKELLSTKTKLVVTHQVSNTLGSVLPIEEIVSWSHDVGAKVLVDACQSVPHMVVDAQKLDVDFLVATSHKMCGPTAIGFLYAKSEILSAMPPFLSGGEMVADVFEDHSTFGEPPSRFEAGAPPLAQAVGLAAAIDYLSSIGMQRIHDYETELANYLYHGLSSIPRVHIYGPSPSEAVHRAPLCSFKVKDLYPSGIATYLYELHGVAICSGHHCAQPLHRSLGKKESARASLRFYNTMEEVDFFIEALDDTIHFSRSRIFLDKQRGWREDMFKKGTRIHRGSDCSESEDDYKELSDCSEDESCSSDCSEGESKDDRVDPKDGSNDDSMKSK